MGRIRSCIWELKNGYSWTLFRVNGRKLGVTYLDYGHTTDRATAARELAAALAKLS